MRQRSGGRFIVTGAVLLLLLTAQDRADIIDAPALVNTGCAGTEVGLSGCGSMGWEFVPAVDIYVTGLGFLIGRDMVWEMAMRWGYGMKTSNS